MGKPKPKVLCLGGSDPQQGAGVEMDARVVRIFGMRPLPVVTVETLQTSAGLQSATPRPLEEVADDLLAALEQEPAAIKVGALGDALLTEAIAEMLEPWVDRLPLVVDPVTQASRAREGVVLNTAKGRELILTKLLPLAWIITPNRGEFAHAPEAYAEAAAALVKGGHGEGAEEVVDLLLQVGQAPREIRHPRLLGATAIHGTGCALATALTCLLLEAGARPGQDRYAIALRATELMHGWLEQTVAQGASELQLKPPRWMPHGSLLG